jgi:hypothetical protein
MTDDLIITQENFQTIISLSKYIDFNAKILPQVAAAQQFDLKPWLGDSFYYDLIKNQDTDDNQSLLNGGEYTNTANEVVRHEGIKVALAFYAAARYVPDSNINFTPFGAVSKQSEFSEPVADKALVRKSTDYRQSADAIMYDVIKYIATFPVKYPKYKSTSCSTTKSSATAFISPVSRV